ncbi:hypothetical protein VC279_20145, partial [Xanthomonas sp. WHRI 10064A]|uniref:hypothetical protein n=1 Tax=unclassified Xanthomonas TaxID=2643310 RepID=UPI002B2365BE
LIGKTFDQNHGSDPNAVLQGLSHAVLGIKAKAIQNSTLGNFMANTAGSGNSKNSTTIRFSGNKQL